MDGVLRWFPSENAEIHNLSGNHIILWYINILNGKDQFFEKKLFYLIMRIINEKFKLDSFAVNKS